MADFILSACSTADITREHFEQRDIHYICFHYQLDNVDYVDDLGETMSFDKFYQAMVDGADTRTSQINAAQFEEYFTPFLEKGLDVLHLTLSSGISGTYNSALMAKKSLEKKFPGRKVNIVDSMAASSGFGLLIDKLADLRDEGKSMDEITQWAEENKMKVHHWVFATDLTFFIKGGRISKTSGMVGKLLNICPMINVDVNGKLAVREKIRTKRKAISTVVERMVQHAEGGENYAGKCYISNSACYDDARAVADLIEARFPHLNGKVEINHIGTTIGSHTGPGTVALFFWGDERVD